MNTSAYSRLGLLALLLGGCASATSSQPAPSLRSTPASTPVPTPATTISVTATPRPTDAPICPAGSGEVALAIDAKANLFGAGLDEPPQPGGGGGGVLPPMVDLPLAGSMVIAFPCTGGLTDFASGPPLIGPEGFAGALATDVESHGGISGMLLNGRVMFLAGVFISDAVPVSPAPERLDFTDKTDFKRLSPELGQTFFIGDGAGATFIAPAGATRLYLGFVDALFFTGEPGWYGNNRGALEATVLVTPG